jgi:hypothetical protein
VNIEVPELLPSSRGYDVDAHALLALAAVQARQVLLNTCRFWPSVGSTRASPYRRKS